LFDAARRLEAEVAALRRDEATVRAVYTQHFDDPVKKAVADAAYRQPPPSGDPEWAHLARKLTGGSASTVP
jgi:hypothetical protein